MKKIKLILFLSIYLTTLNFSQLSLSDSLLLEEILENYNSCFSYSDSGKWEMTTTNYNTGNISQKIAEFKTVFVRGKGFRFFYADQHLTYPWFKTIIIHENFRDTFSSTYYMKFGKKEPRIRKLPFERSIASATGITLSTSYQVPKMLMKDSIRGRYLLEGINKLERLSDESFEGKVFYIFKLSKELDMRSQHNKMMKSDKAKSILKKMPQLEIKPGITRIEEILWFEKESKLLYKIQYTSKREDSLNEKNVTFSPRMNHEIADKSLLLNLPKE